MSRAIKELNDPALIDGLRDGCARIRWRFVLLAGGLLMALFRRWQRFSYEDREELTFDVLYKVMIWIDKYDATKGTFTGWIFAIARNTAIDAVKRKDPPLPSLPLSEADRRRDFGRELFHEPNPDPSPKHKELLSLLSEALLTLNPMERKVLEAKFSSENQTFAQIAQDLGRSEGYVKTTYYRALRKLIRICRGRQA